MALEDVENAWYGHDEEFYLLLKHYQLAFVMWNASTSSLNYERLTAETHKELQQNLDDAEENLARYIIRVLDTYLKTKNEPWTDDETEEEKRTHIEYLGEAILHKVSNAL